MEWLSLLEVGSVNAFLGSRLDSVPFHFVTYAVVRLSKSDANRERSVCLTVSQSLPAVEERETFAGSVKTVQKRYLAADRDLRVAGKLLTSPFVSKAAPVVFQAEIAETVGAGVGEFGIVGSGSPKPGYLADIDWSIVAGYAQM